MIFSLTDCDLELFTFADNCFRGFKHIKHCFLVNSAFLLPFSVWLKAFVFVQLDTGLEIFLLISDQKVCHYLDGDKGGRGIKANDDKVLQGGRGSKIGGRPVTYFDIVLISPALSFTAPIFAGLSHIRKN